MSLEKIPNETIRVKIRRRTINITRKDRIKGSLYGLALGDSWGYPLEFLSHEEILKLDNIPVSEPLIVSDDTQMSLYNIRAMTDIANVIDVAKLDDINVQNITRKIFAKEHLNFANNNDNDRAPGITCMDALYTYATLRHPKQGNEGANNNSKGCGTIMRSGWLGLFPLKRETIWMLAILQSQTTHGNPTAWISAAIHAVLISDILNNRLTEETRQDLFNVALGILENFGKNVQGYDEVKQGLTQAQSRLDSFRQSSPTQDVNDYFGEGWTADENLYNALAVASRYTHEPINGIKRLVTSNGDSDSIGAVGGAILGCLNGYKKLSPHIGKFEPRYEKELAAVNKYLQTINHY